MKQILIVLILLVVVSSTLYISFNQPNNTVALPVMDNLSILKGEKSVEPELELSNASQVNAINAPAHNSSTNVKDNVQVNVSAIAGNSAVHFNNLPKEMQDQIKQLNGRNNKNAKPIEVEPGVFLIPAGKGVNSVPVAVINEDGTVSIHEY
jgi:hypothetical protein